MGKGWEGSTEVPEPVVADHTASRAMGLTGPNPPPAAVWALISITF